MSKRIKGLVCGDLVTPTGFSRVLHNIIGNLDKKKFDIVGLGVNYRGDPHNYDFRVYPATLANPNDIYGLMRLPGIIQNEKPDFIFILNDVWVINEYLSALKKIAEKVTLPRIIVYFPVDAECHDKEWYNNFDIVNKAAVYTEFGAKVVQDIYPQMKLSIVPHGVDTRIFYKKYETRKEAKQAIFRDKPDLSDSYIVLNANRNQPRKRLDITMEGFAKFAKDKPISVKLYMHTGVRDACLDIVKLSFRWGIDNRLILTNLKQGVQTESDQKLNDIYNACDVGINTSMGEGWGLTSIEHAITGAPQLIPNHSAIREVFDGCGLTIPTVTSYTFDHTMTVGKLVSPDGVADELQRLYDSPELYQELSEKAMTKFTTPEYQWSNIAKRWQEIFTEIVE